MSVHARSSRLRIRPALLDTLYLLSDGWALVLAYWSALFLRFSEHAGPFVFGFINGILGWDGSPDLSSSPQREGYILQAWQYLIPIGVLLYGLYAMQDLYQEHRFLKRRPAFPRVVMSNLSVFACVVLFLYFRRNLWHPRSFFITVFLINTLYTLALRAVLRHLVAWLRRVRDGWRTPVLLVGETQEAAIVRDIIEQAQPHGMFIADHVASPRPQDFGGIARRIKRCGAELVIVADDALALPSVMHLLDLSARLDVAVKVLTRQLSVLQLKACERFDTIRGIPLVHFEEPSASDKNEFWRRALSRLLAGGALLLLSPLFLMTALLIKCTDRGPVFFVQERFGVDRHPFRMYKFRTMRVDAESLLDTLEERNEAGTGLFKLKKDPRVTPVGGILRRFSIDELPQIFNVLKGDMRIVGPRPLPKRDLNNYYEDWHYHRHNGRPGLTCLWQVSGRSDIDFENMCILDVYYLRNHNWPMDLRIVLKTVGVVLFGKGAY